MRRVRTFLARPRRCTSARAGGVGDDGAAMTVMELLRAGTTSTGDGPGSAAHRRSLRGRRPGGGRRPPRVFVLPALLVWVAASESTVSWTSSLGVGASLWLLGTGRPPRRSAPRRSRSSRCCSSRSASPWAPGPRPAPARDAAETAPSGSRATPCTDRSPAALGAWTAGYAACALPVGRWSPSSPGPDPVVWTLVLPVRRRPRGRGPAGAGRACCGVGPSCAGPRLRRPAWLPEAVRRALRPGLEGAGALCSARASVICVVLRGAATSARSATCRPSWRRGWSAAWRWRWPSCRAAQPRPVGGLVHRRHRVLRRRGRLGHLDRQPHLAAADGAGLRGAARSRAPSPGCLPLVALLPVAVGAFVGWRALRAVARLSTERTKLTVAGTAVVVAAGPSGCSTCSAAGRWACSGCPPSARRPGR